jgi:ABC-type transport system substrate-binding protein
MQIALLEQATMIINVVTGAYQAVSWQQFDAPHPNNDSVWWSSRGAYAPPTFSLNFARNGDQQIEDALNDSLGTSERGRVKRDMAIVQQRFAADVPYVWLYHSQMAIVASKRVANLVNYRLPDGAVGLDLVQGAHPLYQVWLV